MLKVKVASRNHEAQNIYSFELVARDENRLPPFSAGSHIDVHLPGGITRQYSLYNNPASNNSYKIAVLLAPQSRGGSAAMHQLKPGDEVTISEPRNFFPLSHDAKKYVLFAGGIGITPIFSMAERLSHSHADFELHYYSRSPEHAAFTAALKASDYAHRVNFYFDDAPESKPNLQALLANRGIDEHLFICGPTGFMDFVLSTAKQAGWTEEQLHREYFANDAANEAVQSAFEITIASTQTVLSVPANKSILQVLHEHDIEVPYSCEQGVCGTCVVRVIEGVPDHRDLYFSENEKKANDQLLTCCSRASSKHLLLDL